MYCRQIGWPRGSTMLQTMKMKSEVPIGADATPMLGIKDVVQGLLLVYSLAVLSLSNPL